MESYDENTLKKINKAGSTAKDFEAIQLLRNHNIISLATYVVGFGQEKLKDIYNSVKQMLIYDPDQIQLLYATPHKWTPYYFEVEKQEIVTADQSKWDYKHQVLKTEQIPAWLMIILVKAIEIIMQVRPKAIARWWFHSDKKFRAGMFWYNNIGKRVWVHELVQFFFQSKRLNKSLLVSEMWKY